MKRFRLYWGLDSGYMPHMINADNYKIEKSVQDSSNVVVNFYRGDEIVATMLDFPDAIMLEEDPANIQE